MDSLPKIPRFLKNSGGWIDFEIHFTEDFVHRARYRYLNIFFSISEAAFSQLGKLYVDCVRSVRINAKLRQENTSIAGLPPFPPKIVFISHQKLEQRRAQLENWLQAIASLPHNSCIYQQYANFVRYCNLDEQKGCEKSTTHFLRHSTYSMNNMKISECKAKSSFYVDKKEIKVFFLDGSFVSILTNGKRLSGKNNFIIKK